MQWLLYAIGFYVAICYLWGMYMVARLYFGGRVMPRLQRRLTRLLPGRSVARAKLRPAVVRTPTSPARPARQPQAVPAARAA